MSLALIGFSLALAVLYLAQLLHRYPDRAIGTSYRPDLISLQKTHPLIGHLIHVLTSSDRAVEHRLKDLLQSKTSTLTLPFGTRIVYLQRPEWIEHVQKTRFENYVKGRFVQDIFDDVLGTGIFSQDGHVWFRQRKASSYIFSANSFRTVITTAIEEHLEALRGVLDNAAATSAVVPLNETFMRFTLDTFASMAFGRELHSLEADRPVAFAEAFDYAQTRLADRFDDPLWRLRERWGQSGKKMREAIKTIDAFVYGIIDEREREGKNGEGGTDLLALYRGVRDEKAHEDLNDAQRDAVLNLLLAGRDTTAQALAWTYFYITNEPSLLKPLRQEIAELGASVTYDNYRLYTRTTALFLEVLRLHPSVPKNAKFCLSDDVLPHGLQVKTGDVVVWTDWAIARDQDLWGPDAAEMKPERWIEADGSLARFSPWQAHMFNGGPRLCLGQNLATFEAVATIVSLTNRYNFRFAPGWREKTEMTGGIAPVEAMGSIPTPLYGPSVTLPMKAPMELLVSKRTEA